MIVLVVKGLTQYTRIGGKYRNLKYPFPAKSLSSWVGSRSLCLPSKGRLSRKLPKFAGPEVVTRGVEQNQSTISSHSISKDASVYIGTKDKNLHLNNCNPGIGRTFQHDTISLVFAVVGVCLTTMP